MRMMGAHDSSMKIHDKVPCFVNHVSFQQVHGNLCMPAKNNQRRSKFVHKNVSCNKMGKQPEMKSRKLSKRVLKLVC